MDWLVAPQEIPLRLIATNRKDFKIVYFNIATEFVAPVWGDEKYVSPKLHIVLLTFSVNLL